MAENIQCTYHGIAIEPAELHFEVEEGYPYLSNYQWLHVRKAGSGELPPLWAATADASWIDLGKDSGSVPEDIRMNVRHFDMPAGDYEGQVTFTSMAPINTPITIPIKLTITPKPAPTEPLEIITATIPAGVQGENYSCQFEAKGGKPPYSWDCSKPPPGTFAFDCLRGKLDGVPDSSGVFTLKVSVEDSNKKSDEKEYILSIAGLPFTLAIDSPIGGEVWYKGETHDIAWITNDGQDVTLDIDLFCNKTWYPLATNVPAASLKYSWLINVGVDENAFIKLVSSAGPTAQSETFAIREKSGCMPPWPISSLFNFLKRANAKE